MRDPKQLAGHVFILHAEDGSRVSCGVIQLGYPDQLVELETTLEVIPSDDAAFIGEGLRGGEVTVLQNLAGLAVADGVCYLGFATRLEPDVVSYLVGDGGQQCNVKNGCGAHIHSGTGCTDVESQGGHYYDSATLPVDPWQLESYYTTDTRGTAALIGCTITGTDATDYPTKPFIVHMTDGGRTYCGVLEGGDEGGEGIISPPLDLDAPTDAPLPDIFTILEDKELTTLLSALQTAGLVDALKYDRDTAEGPPEMVTLFAPTNAAFNALPDDVVDCLLLPKFENELINVLTYHVINDGRLPGSNAIHALISEDGQVNIYMVNAEFIEIDRDGTAVTINGVADVVEADLMAVNGVVHTINNVLLPAGT